MLYRWTPAARARATLSITYDACSSWVARNGPSPAPTPGSSLISTLRSVIQIGFARPLWVSRGGGGGEEPVGGGGGGIAADGGEHALKVERPVVLVVPPVGKAGHHDR